MEDSRSKLRATMPPEKSGVSGRGEKVSKSVARLIIREIAERGLEPGSSLPPEQAMARQYGVGRSSIREALRLLEAQGLIVIKPGVGGGPTVGLATANDLGKTVTLFLQSRGTRFSHVLEAMAPMEGVTAALAAQRCAAEGPAVFDKYIPEEMVKVSAGRLSDEAWVGLSGRFHHGLWELAGNDVIGLLGGAVGFIFAERVKFDAHPAWLVKERRKVQAEHLELAGAIRAGNVELARSLNEAHYRRITRTVRKMYPHLAGELIDWH
jgi:DNA-binding FadR family transcriptional regulator